MERLPDFLDGSKIIDYNGSNLALKIGLHYGANDLFELSQINLEHGNIYAVVAPNGSGKSSFVSSITSLPNFPHDRFSVSILKSDWVRMGHINLDEESDKFTLSETSQKTIDSLQPLEYLLYQFERKRQHIEQTIEELEERLGSEAEGIAERLDVLYELLDNDLSSEKLESTANFALKELGFFDETSEYSWADINRPKELHEREIKELSGGWLYRLKLASTVLSRPDLLIIDEPSFLDDKGTEWLIKFLKEELALKNKSIVIMITHKEHLLESLATQILSISSAINSSSKMIHQFHGSYESFLLAKHQENLEQQRERKANFVQDANAQRAERALEKKNKDSLKNLPDKYGSQSKRTVNHVVQQRSTKMQSAQKNIARRRDILKQRIDEKLDESSDGNQLSSLKNIFIDSRKTNKSSVQTKEERLISVDSISFSFDAKTRGAEDTLNSHCLFHDISATISSMDRIALVGPNGSGKSTLLKLIVGDLQPVNGTVNTRACRYLYFPQNAAMDLVLRTDIRDLTASELVQAIARGSVALKKNVSENAEKDLNKNNRTITTLEARAHLGKFGLTKQIVSRPVGSLSTGERTRVYLALLMLEFTFGETNESVPELLILDEISDNLDVDTVDSLVEALSNFDGAVLCVSHEITDFLERFCSIRWELKNGSIDIHINENCDN